MNANPAPVLAIDLPSGLDADRGVPLGACVRATRTVTMAGVKAGFLVPGADAWVGMVSVADIGRSAGGRGFVERLRAAGSATLARRDFAIRPPCTTSTSPTAICRPGVIPLIAVAAVALCVALVIIVVSVMTGFLDMVKNSGRALMGDVVVSFSVNGIPYYEDLIERIEALPEAEAAAPIVDGYGLLKMPYPRRTVEGHAVRAVLGRRAGKFRARDAVRGDAVVEACVGRRAEGDGGERLSSPSPRERRPRGNDRALRAGVVAPSSAADGPDVEGMAMGIHVSAANRRQSDGSYTPVAGPFGYWFMPAETLVLSTLPADTAVVSPEPESAALQVVNEFNSGVFVIDEIRIIIPIQVAQRLSHLNKAAIVDDDGEETDLVDPARATMILVRAAPGVAADTLRDLIADVYESFRNELVFDETVSPLVVPPREYRGVLIQTWLQQQSEFIAPVEKERELMRILFSIIYLVCAGLVLAIFWAIVFEKTRDIGILRSIGASRMGIGFIFLRYGAIIGVIGAVVGLGLAYLVIHNINAIHDAMGREVPRLIWTAAHRGGLPGDVCHGLARTRAGAHADRAALDADGRRRRRRARSDAPPRHNRLGSIGVLLQRDSERNGSSRRRDNDDRCGRVQRHRCIRSCGQGGDTDPVRALHYE